MILSVTPPVASLRDLLARPPVDFEPDRVDVLVGLLGPLDKSLLVKLHGLDVGEGMKKGELRPVFVEVGEVHQFAGSPFPSST